MSDVATPLVVSASSFSFLYPSTIIQSSIICFGLPLDLFPSIFPSITVFNSDSPLRVCSIHFFYLIFIVRTRDLSSPIVSNISSFVLCSVQLTFSILLQLHISKASSPFISSFLIVHVSAPYSTTPYHCLYHPYLQCSVYFSSQKFSPL